MVGVGCTKKASKTIGDNMKSDKMIHEETAVKEIPILERDWNTFIQRVYSGVPCAVKNCTQKYVAVEYDGKNIVVNHFGVRMSIPMPKDKDSVINTLNDGDSSHGTAYIRYHGSLIEIPLTRSNVKDLRN